MQRYHEDGAIEAVSLSGKGMTQIYVVGDGDEWTVKTEIQALGTYTDRVTPIAAAIEWFYG
jgi:hypothetical protein